MPLGDEWPDLLTVREVCHILNVHPNTLRNWDRVGRLRAIRVGIRHDRRWKKEEVVNIYQHGEPPEEVLEKSFGLKKGRAS